MMTGLATRSRWDSQLDVTTSTSFSCSNTGKILLRIVLSLLAAIPVWGAVTTDAVTIDATTWTDAPAASSTVTTPAFSTVSGNELVLAFVSADYLSGTNTTVTAVSGGGLTWALVVRTNAQSGSAEIWRAFATVPLSNVSVTATLSHKVVSSITVMSFAGVDTTGTNGSGAIGATGTGNARTGAPSASLTTTRAGSWVFGVGDDYDNAINRTLGPNQILVHQDFSPTGDTYWVQGQSSSTPLSGTNVTINDTAPTTDRYNLSICEILPSLGTAPQTWSISGTISPAAAGSGATVTLSGAANATTTANASGNYTFTGLANGNYTVTPSISGYAFTPPNQAVTMSGANLTGVNFTGAATSWSISGTISPSAAGSGATVTLSGAANATTTANASGNYTFTGLANGNYTVTPSRSGYTFTPPNQAVTMSGANLTGVNFTGQSVPTSWSISGTISPSAAGSGATVTLSGAANATTTANASGNYTFTGIANGNYTVTPSISGYAFTPPNQAVTMSGANLTGVNFTGAATSWSISGTISPSAAGSGATVTLSGAANATTTANASGNYTFTGLANGNYTVTPSISGYAFTPPNQAVTMSGANLTGVNFTGAATSWSISGTISPSAAGSGATVTLSGAANATTTANASGNYTFTGLANGNYTVTPSHTGYTFTPPNQTETMSGANLTGVNFTGQSQGPSWNISGTISPSSAASVTTVTLSGAANATTTPNASGNYTFTGLANGVYSVSPTSPSYGFNPRGQTFSVYAANVTGLNFSGTAQSTPTFTISGTISGGSGAAVTLSGAANATTTAGTNGTYNFSGLTNGSYTITPSNQGYSFSPPAQSVVISGSSASATNFTAAAGYMISGTLSPPEYSVGATVTLTGPVNATVTVTGSSTFAFTGLPAGSYTVTPSGTNVTFNPTSQEISISDANVNVPSFSATGTENVIFFDNFSTPTLSSGWTVISRHGEYAQNETECNIPQMVASGSGMTISSAAENWTCGDFNIDASTRHTPSSWPYITGDVQWTSQSFNTGTVEVRAKFPSYATSLWPAIWMLGSNCQTTNIFTADTGYSDCSSLGASGYIEADLVECYSGQSGFCQFHVANPSFGIGNGCDANYTVDTNWHIFTTVWTATSFKQYMDGVLKTTCNQAIKGQMFLIIQTQTGGSGGTPNNADLPAQLKIDYVKVTQP